VLLAAAQAGLEAASYAPRLVKQTVAGNGGAEKPQVAWMVARLLGISEADLRADVADALAVALCHAAHARPAPSVTAAGPSLATVPGAPR
jgi:crossover junction endodeoxyribonuclease RuvC